MVVLVLSADPDFRRLLAFLLRHHGLAVATADADGPADGSDACDRPALLLVDLYDAETAAAIAATAARSPSACPRVALAPTGERIDRARALVPAAAYAALPLRPRELMAVVWQLLGQDRPVAMEVGRHSRRAR